MSPRLLFLLAGLALACDQPSEPIADVPAAPTTVLTSARTEEIIISWKDVSDETSFRIEVRSGDGPWMLLKETAANVTMVVHQGVLHREQYFYRVAACNAAGCSEWVETSAKWETGAPPEMLSVTISNLGATSATFSATGRSGGLPVDVTFILHEVGNQIPVFVSGKIRARALSEALGENVLASVDFFNLKPETDYRLSMHAENSVGSAPTLPPTLFKSDELTLPSFSELRASVITTGALLSGKLDPGGVVATYVIEVVPESLDFSRAQQSAAAMMRPGASMNASTIGTFFTLEPGNYKWRVRATNSVGTAYSPEQRFTR